MSDGLSALVDQAHRLRERIEFDQAELKALESAIIAAALKRPEDHKPLVDEEREGRQFLARGHTITVPVLFTADQLVKTFRRNSALHQGIKDAAGDHFTAFFKPVDGFKTFYDEGKEFRAKAREILAASAPAFISACLQRDKDGIPKSQTKIEWDRATPMEPEAEP